MFEECIDCILSQWLHKAFLDRCVQSGLAGAFKIPAIPINTLKLARDKITEISAVHKFQGFLKLELLRSILRTVTRILLEKSKLAKIFESVDITVIAGYSARFRRAVELSSRFLLKNRCLKCVPGQF